MNIKFSGGFRHASTFYVLDADVPLILGMQFLTKVDPDIDWNSKSVFVKCKGRYIQLHSQKYDVKQQQMSNVSGSEVVKCENSFGVLPVEECSDT